MAPANKGKVLFTCREAIMVRPLPTEVMEIDEKCFNHKPIKYKSKEPLFDDMAKKYKCATPGCPTMSKFKGNIA